MVFVMCYWLEVQKRRKYAIKMQAAVYKENPVF